MKSFWKTLTSALRLTYGVAPVYFLIANLFNIAQGVSMGLYTIAMANLLDCAEGGGIAQRLLLLAAAAAGIQVLRTVFNGVFNFMAGTFFQFAEVKTVSLIHSKISRLSGELFEKADVLDCVKRAERASGHVHNFSFTLTMIFTLYIPYFLVVSLYYLTIDARLVWIMLFVFLPVALSQLLKAKLMRQAGKEQATLQRMAEALSGAFTEPSGLFTVRACGATDFLTRKAQKAVDDSCAAKVRMERRAARNELLLNQLTVLGYLGVFLLLVFEVSAGKMGLGVFSALFSSVQQLFSMMEELISRNLGNVSRSYGMISMMLDFLGLPEIAARQAPAEESLRAESVSFRYPDSDRDVIQNLSLTIHKGEHVAIVGENGSGKSTLLKLFCGQYAPSSGRIENGFRARSAVFQNYVRYKMPLEQNVRISDLDHDGDVEGALALAGVAMEKKRFPDGLATMLSRDFGGVEPSGGYWQRIAVARAVYRPCDVIYLDEATSALDALEEAAMYRKFQQIMAGKTAVLITHRLAMARLADRIVVLSGGRIVQEGAHEALAAAEGPYRTMWTAQSSNL
mgnify:FL=1